MKDDDGASGRSGQVAGLGVCKACGERNPVGVEFCAYCGVYLGWGEQRAEHQHEDDQGGRSDEDRPPSPLSPATSADIISMLTDIGRIGGEQAIAIGLTMAMNSAKRWPKRWLRRKRQHPILDDAVATSQARTKLAMSFKLTADSYEPIDWEYSDDSVTITLEDAAGVTYKVMVHRKGDGLQADLVQKKLRRKPPK